MTKEIEFKVGELVEHVTGSGPTMTVDGPGGGILGNQIKTRWWDGTKFQKEEFPPETLRLVETSDDSNDIEEHEQEDAHDF